MYYLHHFSEQIPASTFSPTSHFARSRRRSRLSCSRLLFGNFVIRKLISLKVGQPIRTAEEVRRLAELHGGKQGTPTMGGVLIIGSVFISGVLWARPDNRFVWLVLFTLVYLGALGFVDDYLKVT